MEATTQPTQTDQLSAKFKNNTEARIVSGGKDPDGYWITWDCSGNANYGKIFSALSQEFGEDFAKQWSPKEPTVKQALGKVIQTLSKKEFNIDNLSQGIWAISRKEKTDTNTVGIEYDVQLRVEVDEVGELKFNNAQHDLVPLLNAKYDDVLNYVPSENVREIVQSFFRVYCMSISQRRAGGVEYVSALRAEDFFRYANVISSCSDTDFTAAEVFHGPRAVEALVKHLILDTLKDAEKANRDIDKGVGKKALGSRKAELGYRQYVLQDYKKVLGQLSKEADTALEEAMATVSELELTLKELTQK